MNLEKIIEIATSAHEGQFRRDGVTPYIEHPKAVAERLLGDEKAQAVAWLHDVLEDTETTASDLRGMGVSEDVIVAVELMTRADGMSYDEYLKRVQSNSIATKVKIADMMANLSDTPTGSQIKKYARGLFVLRGLDKSGKCGSV